MVGMVIGPPVGGVLYEAGSFSTPFYVVGGITLTCFVFLLIVMPKDPGQLIR